MSLETFTYRLVLTDRDRVRVQKYGVHGEELGQPDGLLRFDEQQKTLIKILAAKAAALATPGESPISEAEIRQLGEALFTTLFDEGLALDFLSTYESVAGKSEGQIRLELDIDEEKLPDVAALPWEFLYVPPNKITGQFWLATSPHVVLSRRRARWTPARTILLKPGEKLRIALVVSAPVDRELGVVDYRKLVVELEKLAGQLGDSAELSIYAPERDLATRATIDQALETRPHIFHFIGHGRYRENGDAGHGEIAVVNEANRAIWVKAREFGSLFTRHRPGVVLLQACEGGRQSASRSYTSMASQIVQHNVPVVVAMRYEISNATARRFSREFYRHLAEGGPVDRAVQEGRKEIADWHTTRDFASPVLYMRVPDGQLFRLATQRSVQAQEVDQVDITKPLEDESRMQSTDLSLTIAQRRSMRDKIMRSYNLAELQDLCFDLGINHELFPKHINGFARELIRYCERIGRLEELLAALKATRPHLEW